MYSPGGVGGCGCGSEEKGELCELTRGAAAVWGGEGSKELHREEWIYLIRAHLVCGRELIHINSLCVLRMVFQGMVPSETTPHF